MTTEGAAVLAGNKAKTSFAQRKAFSSSNSKVPPSYHSIHANHFGTSCLSSSSFPGDFKGSLQRLPGFIAAKRKLIGCVTPRSTENSLDLSQAN